MNDLIRYFAARDLSNTVYNFFLVLCFVGWFLWNLWSGKRYGLPPWKRVVVSAAIWPLAYGLLYVLYWIESGFSDFGGHYNIVRGFIWFPLIALLIGKLLKIPFRTMTDYIAPGVSLSQGIAHIGCSFAGCCNGFPAEFGIWNPEYECYMVPNQMLETFAALGTFAACALWARKRGYDSGGRIYPLFLILFGATRFLLEFLRDNEKIIGNVSVLALHAGLMVLVGTVWLLLLPGIDRRKKEDAK